MVMLSRGGIRGFQDRARVIGSIREFLRGRCAFDGCNRFIERWDALCERHFQLWMWDLQHQPHPEEIDSPELWLASRGQPALSEWMTPRD